MIATTYSHRQVRSVLRDIGMKVESETWNDFLCLCPFHANRNTPALSVSQTKGSYICFSPECGERGDLNDLVSRVSGRNEYEALRFIIKRRATEEQDFEDELDRIFSDKPEFAEFSQETLDRLYHQMWSVDEGRAYMAARGFDDDTIRYFRIGYSVKNQMVSVPVHSADGVPLGLVGRSIAGKEFKNSYKLPKSKTLFNVHRAKRSGPTAIVNEASFSAMRIHQSGFGGGVATLGGTVSAEQIGLLDRYFSRIIIATDFDDKSKHINQNCHRCHPNECQGHNPGRDLGKAIAKKLPYKELLWAALEPGVSVYGSGKDLDDLQDEQISQAINNAMPDYEYMEWNPY